MLSAFLKLSGLGRFVAASVGAVHKVSKAMRDGIIVFGKEERDQA